MGNWRSRTQGPGTISCLPSFDQSNRIHGAATHLNAITDGNLQWPQGAPPAPSTVLNRIDRCSDCYFPIRWNTGHETKRAPKEEGNPVRVHYDTPIAFLGVDLGIFFIPKIDTKLEKERTRTRIKTEDCTGRKNDRKITTEHVK